MFSLFYLWRFVRIDQIPKMEMENVADRLIKPKLRISDLSDDVLIEIIKMCPMTQWAHLETVNRQFQKATWGAWRSIKEIKLDRDFIYNSSPEFQNNRMLLLNLILQKLVNRTPNLKSISGLTKDTSIYIDPSILILLAQFDSLENLNLAHGRLPWGALATCLRTSKSRGQLKILNLSFMNKAGPEQEFRTAFAEIEGSPDLKLHEILCDTPIFFGFYDVIDQEKLTTLHFVATPGNVRNLIALIGRCTQLSCLDIDVQKSFSIAIGQGLVELELLRSIATMPSELSILKWRSSLPKCHLELAKIGIRFRLRELSLLGGCSDYDTITMTLCNHFNYLTSLELDFTTTVCRYDLLLHMTTRLTELEKLSIFCSQKNQVLLSGFIIAMVTNLKKLDQLHLEYPLENTPDTFSCLNQLIELKTLHITQGIISKSVTKTWLDSGMQFENLALPSCTLDDTGFISLIKKQNRLRRLNLEKTTITDICLRTVAWSCPFLIDLNLAHCEKITLEGVQAILDGCKILKRLFLQGEKGKTISEGLKINKYRKIRFD